MHNAIRRRARGSWSLTAALTILAISYPPAMPILAEDDPATSGRGAVAGKIADGTKRPVVGAQVTLYRWESPTHRWGRWKMIGEPVVSDESGAFRFEGLADNYLMLSVGRPGFARSFRDLSIQEGSQADVDVVLKPPAVPAIQVRDQSGKPVTGARIREFCQRGDNGECWFSQMALTTLGIDIPASGTEGRLELPPLPAGDLVYKMIVDHPDFAPAAVDELAVANNSTASVALRPGVKVTLRVPANRPEKIAGAVVDLRHEPGGHPSTIQLYEAAFDSRGVAELTVEPGNYSWLLLQQEGVFLTPVYSANFVRKNYLRIEPGRNQNLNFDVRRRVPVRGRIVDAETGRPLREMSILGELKDSSLPGWDDPPPDGWSFAGWGQSDADGRYTIDLAEGMARVSCQGNRYVAEQGYYEILVAADGTTVIPEIRLRPIPAIRGLVRNPDGTPASRAVVRLRGRLMTGTQPVVTDAAGRFELQPRSIPLDEETGRRALEKAVVAFDPYRPLSARAEVRLDRSHEVTLTLEPHDPDWLLSEFEAEQVDWERGIVEQEAALRNERISLRAQPAPELDAALWLNTDGQPLKLADLRGKFVLLDFWFTGCGPCHGDFPSVKLVHELYKDRVVVIGIHNNSSRPDAVREHVAKIGLPFPVAVDYPDGRTIARFEPHGIPGGYPDYVLISPEGKVLLDDRTIPHPTLRTYKLEIIRKFLLGAERAAR